MVQGYHPYRLELGSNRRMSSLPQGLVRPITLGFESPLPNMTSTAILLIGLSGSKLIQQAHKPTNTG